MFQRYKGQCTCLEAPAYHLVMAVTILASISKGSEFHFIILLL